MSKHTPGPWETHETSYFIQVISDNGKFVAELDIDLDDDFISEVEANARLIAAAPELLEACENLLDRLGGPDKWIGKTHEWFKKMEATIKKAKGR